MSKQAVVIGSGIGGIAVAIRLASLGFAVDVFEKNSYPGGKLTIVEEQAFRFDAGPSLFTLPHLVTDLFHLAGETEADFSYHEMEVSCQYFFADNSRFTSYADPSKFDSEVVSVFGEASKREIRKYLASMQQWYEVTAPVFLEKSLHKVANYFTSETLKGILASFRLPLLSSMNQYNAKSFTDPRLVQLFNRYATYNGSNPYIAPGLMCMIAHLEHNMGTYLPEKGMHQITEELVALAERKGVKFHYNQPVERILTNQKKAQGIATAAGEVPADLVVCDMDIFPAYKKLMPEVPMPKRLATQEPSSSALIFYWGIGQAFEALDLHNIFFSEDYTEEFQQIFSQNEVTDDPTVYVNITSKFVPGDAPEGKENWFVMVNVPSDKGQDWDAIIQRTRINVIKKLSQHLQVDLEACIETEQILDPRSIESKTSSRGGALYGTSSNDRMAAFLRHPNFHQKIKGLYFCGGSVHPGGGIPLCLLSAKIVSEIVANDYGINKK